MPLSLRPSSPLEPFTFALASPSPPKSTEAQAETIASSSTSKLNKDVIPRPPADFIPERDMHMFGARPLAEERGKGLMKCKRCSKVVLEWAAVEHRRICDHVLDGAPLKKSSKANQSAKKSESLKRRASDASDYVTSPTQVKRSRLDSELLAIDPSLYKGMGMNKAEIKKLKKERERAEKKEAKEKERKALQERKRMRANGPVDLDRQCGVINDKNLPCSRSLTCKTHTVGAKRAVEGRTKSYDLLYLEWQRLHNPNFKEPSKPSKKDKDNSDSINGETKSGNSGKNKEKGSMGKKKWSNSLKTSTSSANGGRNSTNPSGTGISSRGLDEGIADDEEGQREFEDLIDCTRLAGKRVKAIISSIGNSWNTPIPIQPSTNTQNQTQLSRKHSKSISNPTNSTTNQSATTNIGQSNTATASNGVESNTSNSNVTASSTTPNIRNGTVPFSSTTIWRTASSIKFLGVGETLTKALATRMGGPLNPSGMGGGGSKSSKTKNSGQSGSGNGAKGGTNQNHRVQIPSVLIGGPGSEVGQSNQFPIAAS